MQITVSEGAFNAYVARPAAAKAPAVVVLQELFGVNCDIRQTCDELASRGFLTLAPDLFWRDTPGLDLNAWSETDWKRGFELLASYNLDRGVADIGATMAAARTMPGGNGKVGVMGFCLGGLMTFLTAARLSPDAGVSYYGGSTEQHLEEAPGVTGPMLMHLGEEDEYISREAQRRIKAAFADQPNVEVYSYPGCSHAFARHTGTHYDAAAAALANNRTYAFLARHLGD